MRHRRTLSFCLALILLAGASGTALAALWSSRGGTLSSDPQGWAFHPAVAAAGNGSIYVAWTQHRNPAIWEFSGIYVKRLTGGVWEPLGGRIGHVDKEDGAKWPEAFSPSIAVLGTMPYVAWYEGGGYGWGTSIKTSVFVAHWDGSRWVYDRNSANANGALNTSATSDGRNPQLAVVNGILYAAWIEFRQSANYNVIVVKKLEGGVWVAAGPEISASTATGSRIIDLSLADAGGGRLYLAWSEFRHNTGSSVVQNSPGTVQVQLLSGGKWSPLGSALNASTEGYANYLSMTLLGGAPCVAWQERSVTGPNRIRFASWNGSAWILDKTILNVDAASGEAGRPSLAGDGTRVWLAWTEGPPGQKSQLYVRSYSGGVWSAPESGLNASTLDGSSDSPALAVSGGIPFVAWAERNFPSETKQVYLKVRDSAGDSAVPGALAKYGVDGPAKTIPPNTWVSLQAGGIIVGSAGSSGVGDEGYGCFVYSPTVRKALVFGKYHAVGNISGGEDQNALLAYDFQKNRFDVVEIAEDAWSEHLPGIGHDEGHVAADPVRGTYITHGNLTLNSGTAWSTYVYDLRAGRGKRMTPPTENPLTGQVASAYDPVRDFMLTVGPSTTSWIYSPATNNWSAVPDSPARTYPGLVYDSKNQVFVLFGGKLPDGTTSGETWLFDPVSKSWSQAQPPASPPPKFSPYMAYDSVDGVVMMTGGRSTEVWLYDVAANRWTQLPYGPAFLSTLGTGAYLTYDSDDNVFLLDSWRDVWAFRLDIGTIPPPPPPGAKTPSPPSGLRVN